MDQLISILLIFVAVIAFAASLFWTERWNKCVSIGLLCLALERIFSLLTGVAR